MLVDMEAGHGALHTLRIEPARLRHAAAETDGLLLLVFKTVGLVVGHLYDDEADRIRPHINDCTLSINERSLTLYCSLSFFRDSCTFFQYINSGAMLQDNSKFPLDAVNIGY